MRSSAIWTRSVSHPVRDVLLYCKSSLSFGVMLACWFPLATVTPTPSCSVTARRHAPTSSAHASSSSSVSSAHRHSPTASAPACRVSHRPSTSRPRRLPPLPPTSTQSSSTAPSTTTHHHHHHHHQSGDLHAPRRPTPTSATSGRASTSRSHDLPYVGVPASVSLTHSLTHSVTHSVGATARLAA
jgi:hypothetical protein